MTSIYVAAPWVNKAIARQVRDELVAMGHEVTSRWLNTDDGEGSVPSDPSVGLSAAKDDLADIDRSALVLVLTDPGKGAGHHVEFGYALAKHRHIVVVGPLTSIFQHLADHRFTDWPTARAAMEEHQ